MDRARLPRDVMQHKERDLPAGTSGDSLGGSLMRELVEARSGVSAIYRCLDGLVAGRGVRDALFVVEDPDAGRQVFRAGRRVLASAWSQTAAVCAPAGVHTDPMLPEETGDLQAATAACQLAYRLHRLMHQSVHDPLTGLLNRRGFDEFLRRATDQGARYEWPFALAVIDLDGMKAINDTYGHAVGDTVLQATGHQLRRLLRGGDVAARIGGDEFAVLLANSSRHVVSGLVGRLEGAVRAVVGSVPVSYSVGAAGSPDEGQDPDALLRLADERLYADKEHSSFVRRGGSSEPRQARSDPDQEAIRQVRPG